jgi:hypothetical protein
VTEAGIDAFSYLLSLYISVGVCDLWYRTVVGVYERVARLIYITAGGGAKARGCQQIYQPAQQPVAILGPIP